MRLTVLTFLIILLLSDCFSQTISSQQIFSPLGKPRVRIINKKNNKSKIIFVGTKIKCRTYFSDNVEKGRILGIKDSSFIINGKEIQFREIENIRYRTKWSTPIKITGCCLTPFTYGVSLILLTNYFDPGYLDMKKKWKFTTPLKIGIDTLALSQYKKKIEKDSARQNTSSTLFFTLNPLNSFFNQHSIEVGYQLNSKYYLGVEGGIIKADCWWNQNHQLYNGTDEQFPFGYYDGWLSSLHIKRLNFTRNHWYIEANPFFKYLTYDHIHFYNSWGDPHPNIQWIRSEKTNVVGIKLIMGKRIFLSEHFALESIFGISIRNYFRSYTTYWTTPYPYPYNLDWRTNVLIHKNIFLPGIQAGLLLSFGNYKINLKLNK